MSAWIKVLNSMPANPKIVRAGSSAAWLYVCGLCYCNEHLTDGFIARHVLPIAAPGVRKADQLARQLVAANLWREIEAGWIVNDYGEYQRSAEQIREHRARDSARKAAKDSTRNPSGIRPGIRDVEQSRTEKDLPPNPPSRGARRNPRRRDNSDRPSTMVGTVKLVNGIHHRWDGWRWQPVEQPIEGKVA